MPNSQLAGLLFNTWDDADRVFAGLSQADAAKRHDGGSSFAWTLAHITNGMDISLNVRAQKKQPHALLGQERFRFGGTGEAEDWDGIRTGAAGVRKAVRAYLDGMSDANMEKAMVPPASPERPAASVRYLVYRAVCHHYFHIGEVAAKRDRLGHQVGDYPGPLSDAM